MPTDTPRQRTLYSLVAWTGGATFVGSLGWFLYSYLFRFEAAGPGEPALGPITNDVLLFSIFALHHSLFARPRVKRWVSRVAPPELERSLYTWVASVLFILVCVWWWRVPGVFYRLADGWSAVAYTVQGIAIGLTLRSSASLGMLDLAGIPPRARVWPGQFLRHPPLETGGAYAVVRHPLYLSWALFVFATPTMTATRALFAVVSTAYLAIAIPWEERSLAAVFGPEYEAYRQRVRWRMIPGIY